MEGYIPGELWRATHHPHYDVSNIGRVRSRARGTLTLLRPSLGSSGYLQLHFGRGEQHRVHVLVAAAFIGPCPPGQEVLHKDDQRRNNHETNLEYGTRLKNIQDCVARGRHIMKKGEKNPRAILTEIQVRLIRSQLPFTSRRALAVVYGVSTGCIQHIAEGQTWGHVQ